MSSGEKSILRNHNPLCFQGPSLSVAGPHDSATCGRKAPAGPTSPAVDGVGGSSRCRDGAHAAPEVGGGGRECPCPARLTSWSDLRPRSIPLRPFPSHHHAKHPVQPSRLSRRRPKPRATNSPGPSSCLCPARPLCLGGDTSDPRVPLQAPQPWLTFPTALITQSAPQPPNPGKLRVPCLQGAPRAAWQCWLLA